MRVTVRSFAKINLGLCIGSGRTDGFHDLRTIYQTIRLHDLIRIAVHRGTGIEIRCQDERVPADESNTCYRIAERTMDLLGASGKVLIEIEKRLPVQGGLGGASSNAVATLLALERALKKQIPGVEKLRIAAEIGSDLPLFLIGGTILGVGHGEEVYPLPDLSSTPCVLATPDVGVSTPEAFSNWDRSIETRVSSTGQAGPNPSKLTLSSHSDTMNEFSRRLSTWLSGLPGQTGKPVTGVPARGRGRAESPLLDLVRTGIENDFEQVVFPKHPELREVKCVLERSGAFYASLSGSGSTLYGLFRTGKAARLAADRLQRQGIPAHATATMGRQQYWQKIFDC
jgi:4-diphosphocytidyl-2-C-methyl-D-erythritol kinase